ncbi:MAG: MarR family transcriptional regulator [Chloroflexi bacterium]|nr:MarR family transcriptional regulator [Chloroflexota bacterium]
MTLRPRLKVMLPEDLVRLKAQLSQSYPGGSAASRADNNLLFNIGVILSRQQEPITMGDLSRMLDVPLSTATRIVDWLVTNNFVERQPDAFDRRIVHIRFTESGQTIFRMINEFMRARVEKLLGRFTHEEATTLIILLRKLVSALEDEVQEAR